MNATHNRSKSKKFFTEDRTFNFVNKLLVLFFTFLVFYPLVFILFASISSGHMVDTGQVRFFPRDLTFAAYRVIWTDWLFWRSYANAIFLTAAGSLFSMFVSTTGAYALSKAYLPGNRFFNFMVMFTMWFSAGMIPIFLNLQSLNLLNYGGLILGFGVSAFNIVILRSAFAGVPNELLEAGRIDGANELQVFRHISLPSIRPAIATVWLIFGIGRWNGWFWAMVVVHEEQWIPLQVYLRTLIVLRSIQVEATDFIVLAAHSTATIIYATIVMSIIPILVIFPFMQNVFKRGIMEGGLKG